MQFTDLLKRLTTRPFEPFRIQVSDDTTYDIRHPEAVIPTPTAAYIGIPMPNGGFRDVDIVSMEHIVKLLPLKSAKAK